MFLAAAAACMPSAAQTLQVWVHSGPGPERDAYVASVQAFGGDLIERARRRRAEGVINGSGSVAALRTLQAWVRAGYVDAAPKNDHAFVSGQSAISWVGHWVYGHYKKALGDKLGLVPLPRFSSRTVTGSGSWNFGIAASCPHPEAAGRFIEHLMSRIEILRVTQVNGAVPGTGAAMVFSRHYAPDGELRLYAEQLLAGMARVRPPTPHYPVVSRAFAEAVSQVARGADVQQALDRAARTIESHIAATDAANHTTGKTP
ncbi:extracellular solute-binding protein [Piscinibacter sp.]|uniref:extracellular solute-binding protein n=1 Tax=Piscinibacter sp. TaxID=1903157 RepID=UPI002C63AB30|nr:extracellular solute-binding protein [Albitalea sp.]HUG25226.1 extracellular solute-binding protein [Albitalea sp.]